MSGGSTGRRGLLAALAAWAAGLLSRAGHTAESTYGDLKEVTLQGRILSLGDEMERRYGARIKGAGPEKQFALAGPEGQLYTFLDNEQYRALAAGGAGRTVEVKARHFPRSMLLEVVSFRPIPPEQVARRFYCRVCDIRGDDWGPCACCGKEMEVEKGQQ